MNEEYHLHHLTKDKLSTISNKDNRPDGTNIDGKPSVEMADNALQLDLDSSDPVILNESLHTTRSLKEQILQNFPITSLDEQSSFQFFPVSNEENYWQIIKCLKYVRTEFNNTQLKVGLLFGESNFLSLLPELTKLVDVILLADIQPKLHQHNLHLLNTFTRSASPEEFLNNYDAPNLTSDFLLYEDSSKKLIECKDLLFGKRGGPYNTLKKYHFLSSQDRFDACKRALNKLSIIQINFNLTNPDSSNLLTTLLANHQASFTLCNFTNIHHYVNAHQLHLSTSILLKNSPQCLVMYAKGSKTWLSTTLSVGLNDYHQDCLKLASSPTKAKDANEIYLKKNQLSFFQKQKKQTTEYVCYVALFEYDFDATLIHQIMDGEKNINNYGLRLHAHETYEESVNFAENGLLKDWEDRKKGFSKARKRESYWIITLKMNAQKANNLLRYYDYDRVWQHSPQYSDCGDHSYIARKIIRATNNTGTMVVERSYENIFENKMRVLLPEPKIHPMTTSAFIAKGKASEEVIDKLNRTYPFDSSAKTDSWFGMKREDPVTSLWSASKIVVNHDYSVSLPDGYMQKTQSFGFDVENRTDETQCDALTSAFAAAVPGI